MSDLALLIPIAAITVGPASFAFNNWLRAKHGYPLEDRSARRMRRRMGAWGGWGSWGCAQSGDQDSGLEAERKIMLLSNENEKLTGQIGRLEERIRVLERIATDPAERTAREIDALR